MFRLDGKYSHALIYGDYPDKLEDGNDAPEIGQIYKMLNSPAITNPVAIMPDYHYGKGAVIGFTMRATDWTIPNIVGVDIGCGMLSFRIKDIDISDLSAIDKEIRLAVPVGFNIRNEAIADVDSETLKFAEEVGISKDRLLNSIGTLGGGNHFIELGVDERGRFWFTIHTGSRNFGKMVCEYYQSMAKEFCKDNKEVEKDLEFIPTEVYLEGMKLAQNYAGRNRWSIMSAIASSMGLKIEHTIESVHNYINPFDEIIRKGAVSAQKGREIILPFNRRDGIWIMEGLGNPEWNYSGPHGAGRRMSRNQAKNRLNPEHVKEDLDKAGVYSSHDPIDEAPQAYKLAERIAELSLETASYKFNIKPILNVKG